MTLVYFIILLGVLIFVHELGHFIAAKSMGVRVLTFSLGFGPRVVGKKIGDTDYRLSAFPLGGYVRMSGDDPSQTPTEEERPYSFLTQKNWKKIIIVGAGPLFNLIFAIIVLWLVFMAGVPVIDPVLGELKKGFPAETSGLLPGDRILSINGNAVDEWESMAKVITESGGAPLEFLIVRNEKELVFQVTPIFEDGLSDILTPQKKYMVGITPSGDYHVVHYGVLSAAREGFIQTGQLIYLTFLVIGKMFTGEVALNNLGGPILIAKVAGEAARLGIMPYLNFMALISINLAILNLLPVPVLDGGHLLFFAIEGIIRRPINLKVKEIALQIGLGLLVLLMILAFYFDIERLIISG
ncbi:MAG: RIP metalloprotease RseP [Deltaproteobacteria bacterium]|nr:RIP metalloprotease RseP [Candidatus Zymogenaceae bacterium]